MEPPPLHLLYYLFVLHTIITGATDGTAWAVDRTATTAISPKVNRLSGGKLTNIIRHGTV